MNINEDASLDLIRVVFEFPPITGGSITNTIELCARMEGHLRRQVIIAPKATVDTTEVDYDTGLNVVRAPYRRGLEKLGKSGFPVRPLVLLSYSMAVKKEIIRTAKQCQCPYVVHVHGTLLGAIIGLLLRGKNRASPLIITQDSANPFRISRREGFVVWLSMVLFSLRKPDCIMVIDDGTGFQKYLGILQSMDIRAERILHAVDVPNENSLRKKDRSDFVVVSTSRLVPFKRVDLTIRAFALFIKQKTARTVRLRVVGTGQELEKLKKLTQNLDIAYAVDFEGERQHKDISDILSNSDVMIGTSTTSNLNLSIQEAMAHGLPAVVFDAGEMQSLIAHMKDGILVKPGDVKGVAEALALLHNDEDLRKRIGRNARKRIEKDRDWGKRVAREMECYRSSINRFVR